MEPGRFWWSKAEEEEEEEEEEEAAAEEEEEDICRNKLNFDLCKVQQLANPITAGTQEVTSLAHAAKKHIKG